MSTQDDDMEKPLTKRELKATMDNIVSALVARMDAGFARIDGRFAAIDTRFARNDARFEELDRRIGEMTNHVIAEISALVRDLDSQRAQERAKVDSVYSDLPERVTKLEAAVFPPDAPPAKRAKRR